MHIARIAGATHDLGAPRGWDSQKDGTCGSLPVRIEVAGDELPRMLSAWTPTPEEMAAIAAGAPIYLSVVGYSHPPIMLSVGAPPVEPEMQASAEPETTAKRESSPKAGDLLFRSEWETKREISHHEAQEITRRLIASHFRRTDTEQARASIPARPDYDDDLLIGAYIKQQARKDFVGRPSCSEAVALFLRMFRQFAMGEANGVPCWPAPKPFIHPKSWFDRESRRLLDLLSTTPESALTPDAPAPKD